MRKIFTLTILATLIVVSFQTKAQDSFTALNGIPGGQVREIHKDSNGKLYTVVRSDGNIYTSTDNGSTWDYLDVGVTDIYTFYIDGADLYFFTYDQMYKSTDGGSIWNKVSSQFNRFLNVQKVHKSPVSSTTWFAEGPCEGVYVSTDDGVNWTDIVTATCGSGSDGDYQLTVNSNGDIYFVNERLGVLRHKNPADGIWDESKVELVFAKELPDDDDYNLSVLATISNRIVIAYLNAVREFKLASSTSGDNGTFTDLALPASSLNYDRSSLNLGFDGKLYLVSYVDNYMYELADEVTPLWTEKTHPESQYGSNNEVFLYWFSATEVYACSEHYGIFRSFDGGTSWQMANGSGNKALNFGWAPDVEILPNGNIVAWPGVKPKGTWVSTDDGNSFSFSPFGDYGYGVRFEGNSLTKLQDNSLIASVGNIGLMRTTDGINWSVVSDQAAPLYVPDGSGNVYFFYDSNPAIEKTTVTAIANGNITPLTSIEAGLPTSSFIYSIIEHQGDFFLDLENYTANQRQLWKVETSISPFTSQKLITPFPLDGLAGLTSLGGKIYISDRTNVAYSSNQGVSWTTFNYSGHEKLIAINQEGGGIGLASQGSLAVTQDDGQTWSTFSMPESRAVVQTLTQDAGGNFVAGTSGGPVSKFEGKLVLNASELPPPISVSWQPLSGPYGGGIEALVKDSQSNLYGSRTGGLVFKLPAGTDTWQRVKTGLGESRVVYVDDNDALYSADYATIAKSIDGGATWSKVTGNNANTPDITNLIVANNGNIIATTGGNGEGIYVTTDNGASFTTPLGSGSKGNFFYLIKSGSGTLWTLQDNGQHTIYTSTDNGLTWSALNTIDLSSTTVLSINKLEGNAVAVVTDDDILRTTDDGATWTSIKGSIQRTKAYDRYPGMSKVYLAPDNRYFFYNLNEVYISSDQGSSWSQSQNLSNEGTVLSQFIWRNGDIIASSEQTVGVRRSVNGTGTWTTYAEGLSNFYTYEGSISALGSKLYTDASGGGDYLESSDDGQTFISDGTNGYYNKIYKDPLGKLIRYGDNLSFSTNNGESWSNKAGDGYFEQVVSPDGINYFAFFNDYSNNGEKKYVRSTDLVNWTEIPAPGYPFNNHGPSQMAALGNDILFSLGWNDAAARWELYKLSFGGVERVTDPGVQNANNMQYHNGKILLYDGYRGKLTTTTDGNNWVQRAAPTENIAPMLHVSENGFYFIHDMASARMWISKDEGSSWQSIDGFSYEAVFDVEVNLNNGYAYAVVKGDVMYKSNNIILEDDGVNPALAASNAFTPNDGALAIAQFLPALTVQYDEIVIPVNGKKIRLFDVANPTSPVRTYDATDAQISTDGKSISFNYNTILDYSTQYFVIMDAGAFTDIFGNPAPAITANTGTGNYDWDFSVQNAPDNTDPSPSLISSDLTYTKGSAKVFEINVTDNIEVDALSAKIYYRKISDPATTAFNTADLTASGNDAPNLNFSISSLDSWFDAIGLEFYFEVADKAGNSARLPDTNNTYLYSYIDYTNSKPKLDNEQLSFGTTASSFRIIAVPYDLTDNQIATQFDELGEFSKEKFRIGHYNNGTGAIDEYPDNLKTLGRGEGYWVILRNFTDIELDNAKVFENNRDNFFEINLKQGWNQIGNPYPVPISWSEIRVQNANIQNNNLKMYVNGAFRNEDVLPPFQGGFVFASDDVDNLKIRFSGITSGGRVAEVTPVLDADHWELPIAIQQGEFSNQIGGIGMHKESAEGKDRFDDYNPPTITHRLDLSFPSETGLDFAKSIVPKKDAYSWEFTAHAEGEQMVTLSWDNSKFGDNEIDLYLYDESRVALINMRTNTEYKYLAKSSKKFKIYYGKLPELEISPSASLLGDPWPNPTIGDINIPFAITEQLGRSQVIIKIYNATGQVVAEVVDRKYEPGTHTISWSPDRSINEFGLNLIKWTVIAENGEQIEESRRILIK